MKKTKKTAIIIVFVLTLIGLYAWRVYKVNHSFMFNFLPEKKIYKMNEDVPIPPGFYNMGYAKMNGYFVKVTDCKTVKIDELAELGYIKPDEMSLVPHRDVCDYMVIVTAVFHFEGDTNPLDDSIDLTNIRLMGDDYYVNYETAMNERMLFNKILKGSSLFSIASGRDIEILLPFFLSATSPDEISPEYVRRKGCTLLISQYPTELHISLEF